MSKGQGAWLLLKVSAKSLCAYTVCEAGVRVIGSVYGTHVCVEHACAHALYCASVFLLRAASICEVMGIHMPTFQAGGTCVACTGLTLLGCNLMCRFTQARASGSLL